MNRELFEQINKHSDLNLDKIIERNNELTLEAYISEARPLSDGESESILRRYKITFSDYVAYSVRNESFTVWDDYEMFQGKLFRQYSKSRFLDYLANSTHGWILENTVGNPTHFGAVCLNHLLDVAICGEPSIEELLKQ